MVRLTANINTWRQLWRHFCVSLIAISLLQKGINSEILTDSNNDNLDATQSSISTSSSLTSTSEETTQSKQKKTLKFVTELKNVTKEAGGFLRLRCAVTGSIPATNFEWFSNEAPLMEGNDISIQIRGALFFFIFIFN